MGPLFPLLAARSPQFQRIIRAETGNFGMGFFYFPRLFYPAFLRMFGSKIVAIFQLGNARARKLLNTIPSTLLMIPVALLAAASRAGAAQGAQAHPNFTKMVHLVELVTLNHRVPGSSPGAPTTHTLRLY